MRRRYLIVPLLVVVLLSMAIFATGAWSEHLVHGGSNPGINEWHWPTGTEYHGGYLGWLDYSVGYKEFHLGRDFRAPVGTGVHAIAAGTVVAIQRDIYGSKSSRGSAVLIRHRTSTGKEFLALYGHVTEVSVSQGDKVEAGQMIARLNDYEPSHLHFAIHPGPSLDDERIWRGYTPVTDTTYGFVDPMSFLYKNRPATELDDYSSSASSRLERLR
jgi:murein DD-endopeptidase MepM/ murein hydrolase activator NlpD